jgi:hypothetical protein
MLVKQIWKPVIMMAFERLELCIPSWLRLGFRPKLPPLRLLLSRLPLYLVVCTCTRTLTRTHTNLHTYKTAIAPLPLQCVHSGGGACLFLCVPARAEPCPPQAPPAIRWNAVQAAPAHDLPYGQARGGEACCGLSSMWWCMQVVWCVP